MLFIYSIIILLISAVILYIFWFNNDQTATKDANEKENKIKLNPMKYESEVSQELSTTNKTITKKSDSNLLISNYWRKRREDRSEEFGRIPGDNFYIDTNKFPSLNSWNKKPKKNKEVNFRPENKLVLLTQDPYWIYAYWNLTKTETKKTKPILRVYDITDNPAHQTDNLFDLNINLDSKEWYIKVPAANRCYYAEIGLLTTKNNIFIPLANSNPVITPPDKPAEELGDLWMRVVGKEKEYVSFTPKSSLNYYPESIDNPSSFKD